RRCDAGRRPLGHAAWQRKEAVMRFARRHASVLGLVLAVSVGFWGCAHHQARAPQGSSDEIRAELNTLGVPRASFSPEVRLTTSGKGMGALKGAGSGLAGAEVDLSVQQTLRDHVLRAVSERTDLTFVTLDDGGPTVPGESLSYQGLQSEGTDGDGHHAHSARSAPRSPPSVP